MNTTHEQNQNDGNEEPAPGDPKLTGHVYDGIQEYDNPLPAWWTWIFVGTIIFAALYFYVDIFSGQLSAVYSYDQEVLADTERQFGKLTLTPDSATLMKLAKDPMMNKMGASIFQTNCVSCHGRHAEGVACPNLTDDYYIHVKKIEDFIDVITHGRNNGAMPAWGNRLRPNEIIVVAAYVSTLRNTNYPGGKKPEGTIPAPWVDDTTPAAIAAPTTAAPASGGPATKP